MNNNNQLTESQKQLNKQEAQSKLIQIVLEYIYKKGNQQCKQ